MNIGGDDVVVRLLLTNNTSSDVKFGIGSTGPHMESYRVAYSPDGKNHEIEGYINGENADFVKSLPVGIPVKGYVLVKDYDKKYTSIQSLSLRAMMNMVKVLQILISRSDWK